MRRRDFIKAIAGSTVFGLLAARAQQAATGAADTLPQTRSSRLGRVFPLGAHRQWWSARDMFVPDGRAAVSRTRPFFSVRPEAAIQAHPLDTPSSSER